LAKISKMSISNSFLFNITNGSVKRIAKIFQQRFRKVNIGPIYLKYLKHLPPGNLHSHKLFGHNVWFYNGQEYLHGITEIFIDEIYNQLLPDNAFILDCGANIGLSVIYLKQICPTATIIAFEPDATNFGLLQKNIQSHDLRDVELRKEAVWIEDTNLQFITEGTMGSKIDMDGSKPDAKLVKAIRLKNLLTQKVDFLKIDIEGAEYKVLLDLGTSLALVENLFVEYHGDFDQNSELNALLNLFTENGFSFYIKEATVVYQHPFVRDRGAGVLYDVQLNIFCFRRNPVSKN
jgi:FkbM family methyltransferase